jgi:pyruvate dehydrogenase E2 component (dihydrolipoamide acetyltransferase)
MDVKLPKLGEGADSGVVVNVFVKEGDQVARDQAILELENEKAVASVPSTAAGVVTKINVKAGDKISVGQRLISLSGGDHPAAAAAPAAKRVAPELEPETPAEEPVAGADEEIPKPVAAPVASPSVRRLARELGIDLSKVRGSEAGGRIVTGDIRAHLARLQKASVKPGVAAPAPAKPVA